ncbi:MAG: LLM class flavin-dependent oxidoreductase [Rhizomicrobium sp.]
MSVEFIGIVHAQDVSEIRPASGPAIDLSYIEKMACAHEDGDFDRVLVAFGSASPESILIGAHAAAATSRLGLMIAHRPGFTAPTIAARQFATLDQISKGRAAVHIITGGDDAEMRRDGDNTTKDERYARTDEYLDIMRLEWTSDRPFDYHGKFYNVEQGFSSVKSVKAPHIPVYFGGSSEAAIPVAGKHADIYALWGETQAQVRETIARLRAAAAKHGRELRFSLSLRPILAETEDAAWARADSILEKVKEIRTAQGLPISGHRPPNEGSRRLLAAASQGSRLDQRLWTGVAAVTGAQGNSTSLVGTPQQVADALLEYYDLGVTTFLIRGFDPYEDAIDYGRNLIPLVRELVAARQGIQPAHAV